MIPVCGVRFTKAGKIYYFDPGDWDVEVGMRVIVETAQGVECGEIAVAPKLVPEDDVVQPVRRILRVATEEDLCSINDARQSEKEAYQTACEYVKRLGLDMKLVDAEWTFDKQKLVFYFTADERVDFRELVKELAACFKTRIEMRQIGVRDESRMLGGYGVCGRALCCTTWIGDFEPVSIRHAKDQDLSLNPGKISGVCGRLKCCLRFEADIYQEIRQRMPKVGTLVDTPLGPAKVIELHVIKERLTVQIEDGEELRRLELSLAQLEGKAPWDDVLPKLQTAAGTVDLAFEPAPAVTEPDHMPVATGAVTTEPDVPPKKARKKKQQHRRARKRPRHRRPKQRKDEAKT